MRELVGAGATPVGRVVQVDARRSHLLQEQVQEAAQGAKLRQEAPVALRTGLERGQIG